jgi:DNA polymerase-3 subunit alpha
MREQPIEDFVHLHVHSEYSLKEAVCKLEDLIGWAKSWKMQALAVSDKGTVHGALHFYELTAAGREPSVV